jgi:hypothetical protein
MNGTGVLNSVTTDDDQKEYEGISKKLGEKSFSFNF